ncbi:MAG: FAD-dependent oxidoreductase [Bacillota bacterium]
MRKYHQVLIVGGGWSGVSAALMAARAGVDAAICERTDMLLGAGLVGGIMRNNGRFVAAEECIAMGCGELFQLTDSISLHKGISFPGHSHASLYDVHLVEIAVRNLVLEKGISLYPGKRITKIHHEEGAILWVESDDGDIFYAGAFVDATGSSGPPGICRRFGNGCASCIQRCPSFGPRVSIATLLGLPEYMTNRRKDVYGAMSGSCKIYKETLSEDIRRRLNSQGAVVIPLPGSMINTDKLDAKVCQQYALLEYAESIVLLDTGHAKLMTSYLPLEDLRRIPGMENARYADPLAGGKGNSIRFTAVTPRENTMLATGAQNLFVAGEKAGVCVGHTEAIVTGALAGRNSALLALGKPMMTIPDTLATGDYISFSRIGLDGKPVVPGGYGLKASHTFAGSVYFDRMKDLGLYTTDIESIMNRVSEARMHLAFCS